MGRTRLFSGLFILLLAFQCHADPSDLTDLSGMVASLMSSTNLQSMSSMAGMMENLQGLVPSTTSSGGQTTEAAADLSSLFSDFVSKSDSVTGLFSGLSNIENQIGSLLDSFNTSTLLSTLGKAAKVAVVTKVVKESDLWEQLEAAINSTDEYFTSLPQTQKLLELGSGLLNGTKDALNAAYQEAVRLEDKYCTPAFVVEKTNVPTSCTGYNLTLALGGGFCVFQHDGSVRCRKPSVRLVKTPTKCTIKHHSDVVIKTKECKLTKSWGNVTHGYLKPHEGPKLYNVTKTLDESGTLAAVDTLTTKLLSGAAQSYDSVSNSVSDAVSNAVDWVKSKFSITAIFKSH